jgi:hypothetical protein
MRLHRLATAAVSLGITAAVVTAPTAAFADDGTTTSSTGSTTTTTPTTDCAPLPSYVEGRPGNLHVRGATGDYLWHDGNGWHLRVTHRTKHRTVFRGVIRSDAPMTFQRVRDEKQDKVWLSSDGKTLAFRFVNYGAIDGVDFADSCASTVKFGLLLAGHRLGLNHIYIGAHEARPDHNPFVISRTPAPTAA